MEMQFEKIPIAYLQKLTGQLRTQEQTLELRLPDGMPDIGRVLGAWGQVIVRGKEWNSDNMAVSGGVMAWVLYTPESGDDVRSVEAWLPLTMKWELPMTRHDGKILVSCLLQGIDARSTSARKLMVRATVGMLGEAWLPEEAQAAMPGELPEDIELLKQTFPVFLPCEAGEKAFLIEEQLNLPTTESKPEKLLYYSLQLEIADKKLMGDKIVFRGTGLFHILYRGEDSRIYHWDYELPFSQYADLDQEYGQEATAYVLPCVTSLDVSLGENGELSVKAGLLGQYLLCERSLITVAEDAYSPQRSITLLNEELQLPTVLDQLAQTVHAELSVQTDVTQIADVTFYPAYGQTERGDDSMKVTLPGQFQMLYYDEEGDLRSTMAQWEGDWRFGAADNSNVAVQLHAIGKPQAVAGAGNVNLRSDLMAEATVLSGQGLSIVTGLDVGEVEKPNPNRPSLILCKKGNRRLWDIAKHTGSTVKSIMEANHLDAEPSDDTVLLIPVS